MNTNSAQNCTCEKTDISIRKYSSNDFVDVLGLIYEAYAETSEDYGFRLEYPKCPWDIDKMPPKMVAVDQASNIIGVISYDVSMTGLSKIFYVIVKADYRHQGVGSRLFSSACEDIKSVDEEYYAVISAANIVAFKFFEKMKARLIRTIIYADLTEEFCAQFSRSSRILDTSTSTEHRLELPKRGADITPSAVAHTSGSDEIMWSISGMQSQEQHNSMISAICLKSKDLGFKHVFISGPYEDMNIKGFTPVELLISGITF